MKCRFDCARGDGRYLYPDTAVTHQWLGNLRRAQAPDLLNRHKRAWPPSCFTFWKWSSDRLDARVSSRQAFALPFIRANPLVK